VEEARREAEGGLCGHGDQGQGALRGSEEGLCEGLSQSTLALKIQKSKLQK